MATTAGAQPASVQKLSQGRVISYALGDVANNLSFMMTSLFLMAYMTDIAGISAAAAGTIYGVTKIWAGISDLVAGQTVDRANTRWGRLRPWLLWGSLPLAAVLVALFSTPAGLSGPVTVAWILLFDAAFQLCYSFVNIPYGSLSAAMTQSAVDRSRLAGARSIASSVTGVLLAIFLAPQFSKEALQAPDIRMKFTITILVVAAVAVVLYLICFLNTRETVQRPPGKVKMSTTFKMIGQNRPLLMLCLGALFLLGAMFTLMAVQMFYARIVLGSASSFIWLQIANTVGTVIIASFVPAITVKFGKRIGYVLCAFIAIVAYLIMANVPGGHGMSALAVAVIAFFIYGLGVGGTNALMFSMQADTVDYGEWKSGTRAEGAAYSILSFVRKCGQGVGGWIGGIVIGLYGYSKAAVDAGDPATMERIDQGIRVAAGYVPAAFGVLAALVIFFYPLTAQQHKDIVRDLLARRTTASAADVDDEAGGLDINTEGTLVARRPVVTINEQYGAGGTYIGERVAERLGIPFVGSRFTSSEIEQIDRAAEAEPTMNRWLWDFAHTSNADIDAAVRADAESNTRVVRENTTQVIGFVKDEGGVILGRDATRVLALMRGAFHVRLEAPVRVRIDRAAETAKISRETAAQRQSREDRMRNEMSMRLMKYDATDHTYYDLVVNTEGSLDDAVEQIVAAYRQKFPDLAR
ncbi:glycoside-pentoside-hexuronide (GPH):cation symporter [Granulicoccus sp. GXG6511]|uniref:glycoside-pentoside-hexuronide (GPH):cation symporter n=1 Tax=Granulicoccus sp. GXG6511 TaxID=3381351 RepID=UPI003D7C99EE